MALLLPNTSRCMQRSSQGCSTSYRCVAPALPVHRHRGSSSKGASLSLSPSLNHRAALVTVPAAASVESNPAPSQEHNDGVYSETITCPLGAVKAVMRQAEAGILSCSPDQTLQVRGAGELQHTHGP